MSKGQMELNLRMGELWAIQNRSLIESYYLEGEDIQIDDFIELSAIVVHSGKFSEYLVVAGKDYEGFKELVKMGAIKY